MAKKDYSKDDSAQIVVHGRLTGQIREKVKQELINGVPMQQLICEAFKAKYKKDEENKY